jgi:DNA-binding CsgD family transcriptional regulator
VLFLFAVAGIAQAGGMWRARRRAQRWSAEREAELVQSLRKRLAGLDGWRAGAEVRWLLVEVVRRRGLARLMRLGEGMRNLTRREEEFVIHLAAGLRTKEFARIHRLSSGHVYNLSSSVRRKLHVPEAVELSDFIMATQRKGE